jgi:predicted hotdog family 3-hydroxylacyl-ACP dehydratase
MTLDRTGIAACLPHTGDMILLDRIERWDETAITALSDAPLRRKNPFRQDGRLGVAWLVEGGTQAMAVHGYLKAAPDAPPRRGYLAALKWVAFAVDEVTDDDAPLTITATARMGDDRSALYGFTVIGARGPLADGEAMVTVAEPI